MEVVSPITLAHPNGGSKRRFPCADTTSPTGFASSSPRHHSADENMDDCSSNYGFHSTKRRRKNNQECAGSSLLQKENNWSISPFLSGTAAQTPSAGEFVVVKQLELFYSNMIDLILTPFFIALFDSSFQRIRELAPHPLNTILEDYKITTLTI